MKTDRFTDSIRRKLESIRPEFTEKDWTRMQTTLQQASPPQPGAHQPGAGNAGAGWGTLGQPWLLAAAAVSTVVLVGVGLWQRNEINHLRQTVQHLSQHSTSQPAPTITDALPSNPAYPNGRATGSNRNDNPPVRPDTVYVNRYVEVPARPSIRGDGLTERGPAEPVRRSDSPVQSPALSPESNTATNRALASEGIPTRPNNPNITPKTKRYDGLSTIQTPNQSVSTPSDQPVTTTAQSRSPGENRPATSPANAADNSSVVVNNPPVNADLSTQTREVNGLPILLGQIASRPLTLETINWREALTRRAKGLRAVRAVPTVGSAPVSQPVERTAVRFRLGVGTEFDARLWSAGVFGEILAGKHWTLGLGLGRATYMGGLFLTDDDFYNRTKRDFRRNYAPGIGPGREILNIDTRLVRFQVPISIGYRVPLSSSLTLLPTVGTYLNLSNTENVTYYYHEPQHSFSKAAFQADRPVSLANSLAFGTSLEWQRGHWLGQAGPLVTVPIAGLSPQPEPNWQSGVAVGMRIRVFYQF